MEYIEEIVPATWVFYAEYRMGWLPVLPPEPIVQGKLKVIGIDFERYYVNGEWHNESGPALVIYSDHLKTEVIDIGYFLNDREYSQEEWEKQMQTKLYW